MSYALEPVDPVTGTYLGSLDWKPVPHALELTATTPGLSVQPREFNFKCLEHPSDVRVGYQIRQSTDSKFFFLVTFDPPLKQGERVKYQYEET